MKALTLTQPWATLVAIGAKQIETRSWHTSYRGLVAIHAAKGFPKSARALCVDDPFRTALERGGVEFKGQPVRHWYHSPYPYRMVSELPLGAIVAVATLADVFRTDVYCVPGERRQQEHAFGDFTPGRYAWLLDDVRRLTAPIQCKGALGLWTVPADIESQIQGAA
jgi:pimeloyl-ACP methyl ester carboxylesterase